MSIHPNITKIELWHLFNSYLEFFVGYSWYAIETRVRNAVKNFRSLIITFQQNLSKNELKWRQWYAWKLQKFYLDSLQWQKVFLPVCHCEEILKRNTIKLRRNSSGYEGLNQKETWRIEPQRFTHYLQISHWN